ncbi:MAG: GNAT family protein [Gammaproteobacteria bacterium]
MRPLTETDGQAYRDFRLYMLEESPTAFSADRDETARRPLSHFIERARDDAENFIVGAFAGHVLVGSAGGFRDPEPKRRHLAMVWGMYVQPAHRGSGLGARLLGAVLDRLHALPGVEQVQLGVTAGNEPALRLYERAGFEVYGREPAALKVAGVNYDELLMSLRLKGGPDPT